MHVARAHALIALRCAVAMLVAGSLLTGFGEAADLSPGSTTISGTPTVTAGTGLSTNGTLVSGQVLGLAVQDPPVLLLSTPGGQIYVYLADPTLKSSVHVGEMATFLGQYLAVDLFSASQLVWSGTVAQELSLGAPIGQGGTATASSQPGQPSATSTSTPKPTATPTRTSTPTRTPTPTATRTACLSSQTITLSQTSGNVVLGSQYKVKVSVSLSGNCSGKLAYLKIRTGPNTGLTLHQTLDSNNQATFTLTSAAAGTDSFRVWLDLVSNGNFDNGESNVLGSVTWTAPTPTPTPKPKK